MKRGLTLALALLFVLGLAMPTASMEAEDIRSGVDFDVRILADGTVEIIKYRGKATSLDIPGSLDGLVVSGIGDAAFDGCSILVDISIPIGVSRIGANPFRDCFSLTQITVHPDSPALSTIAGVLFSKPDKRLVW